MTSPIQEVEVKKIQTTQRTKNIITYFIALICLTSLFSFEFVNGYSEGYFIAKNEYQKGIDNVDGALTKIKNKADQELFFNYQQANEQKNLAKKNYHQIKEEESVFGFKNKKIFLAQLGPMICFFVYILFMIHKSFKKDKRNKGILLLHGTVLTGPLFYFYWIFQPFQDVSKISYYFATVITAIFSLLIVYFMSRFTNDKVATLNDNLMEVATFTFKNTKPEKREEMLDMIKKIAKNK